MAGRPVTFVTTGGIPVTEVTTGGIPVSEVATGGVPMQKVSVGGIPINVVGSAGPSAFDPATLFNGDAGFFYEIGPDTCFQNSDGTTPSGDGDPVGYITDSSGNGNHATQATTAARPTLRQTAGGLWYLEFDLVDDTISSGFTTVLTSDYDVVMAYQPSGENFVLVTDAGQNSPIVIVGQSGNTGTGQVGSGITLNDIFFDGAATATRIRDGIYTEAQSAYSIGANWTHSSGSGEIANAAFGRYVTGGFFTPGNVFAIFLREGTMTSEERANLDSYMQAVTP